MTDPETRKEDGREQTSGALFITAGAMILAVFALLLLLNRQTGGLFEEFFIYALPIPMVIYAARFGLKNSLMVFAGMCIFSFLFGTFSAVFYAVSSALLGLVLGTCIRRQQDMTKTMLLAMGLGSVFSVLSSVVLAGLFGYDIGMEVDEMQSMMNQMISSSGIQDMSAVLSVFSREFLTQMFIISMALYGLIDGFIVYQLSILVLKRLRFRIPPAAKLSQIRPPRITGFLGLAAWFAGNLSIMNLISFPVPEGFIQLFWVIGYMYLMVFGIIAFCLFLYTYAAKNRLLIAVLTILACFMLPQFLILFGFAYISLGIRDRLLPA